MLKLFWAPGTCALASYIALEEAGAQFEPVRLDFTKGDQRKPEYLKVNPKGRVPALVTDRGILTENPAILAWIAQTWPQAPQFSSSVLRSKPSLAMPLQFSSVFCASQTSAPIAPGTHVRTPSRHCQVALALQTPIVVVSLEQLVLIIGMSSTMPSQSLSTPGLPQVSGCGTTSPVHVPCVASLQVHVPAWHRPTSIVPLGPV